MQKCAQRLESCWISSTEKTRSFAETLFRAEKPILLSSFASSNIITQLCEHKQDLCQWTEQLLKPLWFRSQRLTGLMNSNFESNQHKIQKNSSLSCNVPVQTNSYCPCPTLHQPKATCLALLGEGEQGRPSRLRLTRLPGQRQPGLSLC